VPPHDTRGPARTPTRPAIYSHGHDDLDRRRIAKLAVFVHDAKERADQHLLMRVLTTVVAERSVSRTAIRLNQSQPAISAALRRLREIFNDPLLVRDAVGMVPTARGVELCEQARTALTALESLLVGTTAFDPKHSRQTFRIGSPDYVAPMFMARLITGMRREAADARLVVSSLGPDHDFEQALANGDLDVVIGNWPQPPERLHLAGLLDDEIVCLMRRNHPLARKPLTVDGYLRARHVLPLPYSATQRGIIDTRLASLRVVRDATVIVQSFNLAPYMLVDTDLIFTTSRHFAQFYAQQLPLVVVPSPIDFPHMRFYQLWHDRSHHSPAHRWLRARLTEAATALRRS
jgi:DNA-binding transcriptional LysR family regulator